MAFISFLSKKFFNKRCTHYVACRTYNYCRCTLSFSKKVQICICFRVLDFLHFSCASFLSPDLWLIFDYMRWIFGKNINYNLGFGFGSFFSIYHLSSLSFSLFNLLYFYIYMSSRDVLFSNWNHPV